MLLVENSFTVVTYVKQSLLSLRLFPFTKDFYHLEEVVVYGNSNFDCIEVSYAQYIGSRPAKLKPISGGISSEWYTIFFSYNFTV